MNIIEELQEKQRIRYWKNIWRFIFLGLIVIPVEFSFHKVPSVKWPIYLVLGAILLLMGKNDTTYKALCPRCHNNLLRRYYGNVSAITERFCPYCQLDLLNFSSTEEKIKSLTQTYPPTDYSVVSRGMESNVTVPLSAPYSIGVTTPTKKQAIKHKMPLRLFVRLRLLSAIFAISGIFIAFPLIGKVPDFWLKFIFFAPIVIATLSVCWIAYFMRCPSCKKDLFNIGDSKNCPRCGVEFDL